MILISFSLFLLLCAYGIWVMDGRYEAGPITRWVLFRGTRWRVFLHRMNGPDPDRHLHNHPWPHARSLILCGGYAELYAHKCPEGSMYVWHSEPRWRVQGDLIRLGPCLYHRIVQVLPSTWTLFIAGPRTRDWGFWEPGRGHVPYRTYLGLPADHELRD